MAKYFVSDKNETVRLFQNDFLESLSRVHFTTPLFIYIPVILYLLYLSFFERHYTIAEGILILLAGLIVWTFVEYVMHRFIFHYHAKTKIGKKIMFLIHGVHHDYPSDLKRLVLPPCISIPLATGFYFLFGYTLGGQYLPLFFSAFLTGYLFYDIGHYAIHHFNLKSNYWKTVKTNHMRHHFMTPDKGFGVSTVIWDFVFFSLAHNKKQVISQEENQSEFDSELKHNYSSKRITAE
ncbi:sterol desaturase family protein [Reichenbachiella agarivorans]|uniref:Sterol desaturase family protein n=1 Tax=Reichenbachiella agarivorans TaxID=2979464 RepID=A0ABY6CQW6_9BACT|nr:sterol desaturase family protein [Reichenbachiella agarivorans]UXP32892.1 sterol desaturase family protein [Reichenbachiella agarivorans]